MTLNTFPQKISSGQVSRREEVVLREKKRIRKDFTRRMLPAECVSQGAGPEEPFEILSREFLHVGFGRNYLSSEQTPSLVLSE